MDTLIRWLLAGLAKLGLHVGKEGVFLNELREKPYFGIEDGHLIIATSHSQKHSAKEVFHVQVSFENRQCLIRVFQKLVDTGGAPGEKYRQKISIAGWLSQVPFDQAEFYWMDPDETRHLIQIEPGSND